MFSLYSNDTIFTERGTFNIGDVIATRILTLNEGWFRLAGFTTLPRMLGYSLATGGFLATIGTTALTLCALDLSNGIALYVGLLLAVAVLAFAAELE